MDQTRYFPDWKNTLFVGISKGVRDQQIATVPYRWQNCSHEASTHTAHADRKQ
jgi:hypothetical protein